MRIPKGLLGDENMKVLGSLILSKLQMAAFARADTDYDDRVPYYLYIDEFQNFAKDNFTFIMNEARKYKLALTLAHQSLSRIPKELRSSLLNCPLQACFRVQREDAEVLAKEMFVGLDAEPEPWETYFQKLQALRPRECYVKNKNGHAVFKIGVKPAEDLGFAGESWDEGRKIYADYHAKGLKNSPDIGKHYLRSREEVRREYRARADKFDGEDEPDFFRDKER